MSSASGEPDRPCRSGRWPDIEMQLEEPGGEIKRLQRCINDLASLLALPAIWSGGDPSRIARTLLDVLVSMLQLDLVYVQLNDPLGEAPIEMVRVGQSQTRMLRPEQIGEHISRWLEADPRQWPPLVQNPVGDGDLSILPMRLGLQGEIGIIVAGSRRTDFPRETERLLLNVAANQAAIGLQEARRLVAEKRIANELDQRIAERTKELVAANDELKRQVAERGLAEERLRHEETELKRSEAHKAAILELGARLHCDDRSRRPHHRVQSCRGARLWLPPRRGRRQSTGRGHDPAIPPRKAPTGIGSLSGHR